MEPNDYVLYGQDRVSFIWISAGCTHNDGSRRGNDNVVRCRTVQKDENTDLKKHK